jgi:hypothetical protein
MSLTSMKPEIDLQTRALAFYLQCHIQAFDDVPKLAHGLSESVSMWKNSRRSCPMVDLALSSMALAVFSKTWQHPTAATEATLQYARVLRYAQQRLARMETQKFDEREVDEWLLAASLMSRYEGAAHRPSDTASEGSTMALLTWSHLDGAKAILKVWSNDATVSSATFIIKQTRRELIKTSLLRNLPLPDWMLDGNRFGEHGVELDYDRIITRIVTLRHEAARLQHMGGSQISRAMELNEEAREIDKDLQDWMAQMPTACLPQPQIYTISDSYPWPRKNFFSPLVYSYPAPGNAAVFGQYFAMRMLINSTRFRLIGIILQTLLEHSDYSEQQLECITALQTMGDSLAASIPFSLERFAIDHSKSQTGQSPITINKSGKITPSRASLAVWPLIIASSLEGVDIRQLLWFRSQLASLGRITGDGILECAEISQVAVL